MFSYKTDISKLKLNKIEEEELLRSKRTNVWLENDSSITSGIAEENSTISASSTSSSVSAAIMDEVLGALRGPSALVRIKLIR